jgi:hypothetical protein
LLEGGTERPISLGALIGRVRQGTGSIQGFREDRRNLCKAVYPLYYGAYSSHGPSYDSTFANLVKINYKTFFANKQSIVQIVPTLKPFCRIVVFLPYGNSCNMLWIARRDSYQEKNIIMSTFLLCGPLKCSCCSSYNIFLVDLSILAKLSERFLSFINVFSIQNYFNFFRPRKKRTSCATPPTRILSVIKAY